MATVLLALAGWLVAGDFEWGVKYGLGGSSVIGEDAAHEIRYDISTEGVSPGDLGYLRLQSADTEGKTSHNAGLYCSFQLARKVDSVRLRTELVWHRYSYSYLYKGRAVDTNSLLLAADFGDTLTGHVDQTTDYLSLPVLFTLKQELSAEDKKGNYQGAFVYFGPSLSLLIGNKQTATGGVGALDGRVDDFVQASYTDADPTQNYASQAVNSDSDKLLAYKADLVVGLGFGLKDLFQFGIGKDEYEFDLRLTTGLHSLGNGDQRKALAFRSVVFSIGIRL